ncbi:MAG: hypothetical protein IVW52_03825 [Acidimicrobiales bacterium]|nr:hypothetical protein [Acidimicrobiales bacterium]
MLATGMAFMFEWNPLVHHSDSWNIGSDLWNTFRAAHYVGWGYLGGIYDPANGIITFPGMAALLAPVAMLSGTLHLSESFMPYTVPYPTAALLLVPIELVMAASVVFATDALAESLQVGTRRRAALCVLVAVIAWLTASVWGHPEESLAMTFALYAMIAMLEGKWVRCGWLFSLGIVLQPLVALTLPLFIAATPRGMRIMLAVRSSALSFVLIAVAAAGNFGDTFRALVEQPTPPALNHPTPWVSLTPKITSGGRHLTNYASIVHSHGHISVTHSSAMTQSLAFVAGGPGRVIDVMLSVLVGVLVWRKPQSAVRVLWLALCVLASRCFFEPVMTPYYLAPPLFLALVLAARAGGARFWAAAVLSLEVTILAYHHLNPWIWWSAIVLGLAGIVALGYPVDRVPTDPLDDGQHSVVPEGPPRLGRPVVAERRLPVPTFNRHRHAQPASA